MTPAAGAEEPPRAAHHHQADQHDLHDVRLVDHNGRQISGGIWVCCMPCYWLRTNNSVHKASLTLVTLMVTSLLVASPVLFLISSVPANEQPYKECTAIEDEDCFVEKDFDTILSVCESSECRDIARRIQFSLSWDYDPCKDFYKFACGGWSESHKTKSRRFRPSYGVDLSFYTIQTSIQLQIQHLLSLNATNGRFKKLGLFYSSCLMSFDIAVDTQPMYSLIDKLGGYLPPGSLGPNDITSLITNILKVNGAPLLDVYLDRDINNKSTYAIIIDLPIHASRQGSFFDDYLDIFQNNENESYIQGDRKRIKRDIYKQQSDYYTHIKDRYIEKKLFILEKVVNGMLPKGMKAIEKAADIQQILLFAAAAEQLLPTKKELREHLFDPVNSKPYTIERLQKSFPFITWTNLFNELLSDNGVGDRNIYVISHQYMQSVSEMITRFQNRVVQNALLAIFARDFLFPLVNHTAATDDKYEFCTHVTTKIFSQPVSALYLTQYSKQYLDDLYEKAAEMFVQLKRALFSRIEKVAWLDSETKWRAMDKLAAMTGHFIAWPSLRNQTFVDELITSLNITNNFFDNVVNRYSEIKLLQISQKDENIINLSWPYPFVVNAFYETDDNSIVVPLALLTQPHFSRGVPEYISYGTIGNVIAHEMMHALDYSAIPNSPSMLWVKSSSLSALKTRLNCLASQYKVAFKREFKYLGYDIKVEFDGNATREENIADIGGAKVAWVAWRGIVGAASGGATLPPLPLTPAKMFYLAMAQLYCTDLSPEDYIMSIENDFHTTAPERVNGLLRNSVAFAEVYQCPTGSPMNPANKCIVW